MIEIKDENHDLFFWRIRFHPVKAKGVRYDCNTKFLRT